MLRNGSQSNPPPPTSVPPANASQRVSSNVSDIIQHLQTGNKPPSVRPKPPKDNANSISQLRSQLEKSLGNTAVQVPPPTLSPASQTSGMRYRTLASFDDEDGLSFEEGVEVEVIQKDESGWWNVRIGSDEGWAPSTYLEQMS